MQAATWRKSTQSGVGACVEVSAVSPDNCSSCHNVPPVKQGQPLIAVRDSKSPDGARLYFTAEEWEAFVSGVKDNEFDVSALQAST